MDAKNRLYKNQLEETKKNCNVLQPKRFFYMT